MIKRRNKKANILTENIIFIILNLVFLTILLLFLFSKMQSVAVLEEQYAKQIALIIDSSKPVMDIRLNMEKAFNKKEEGWSIKNIVTINENTRFVTVKLRERGGYSYSFFNDVDVTVYPDINNSRDYVIKINGYNINE